MIFAAGRTPSNLVDGFLVLPTFMLGTDPYGYGIVFLWGRWYGMVGLVR